MEEMSTYNDTTTVTTIKLSWQCFLTEVKLTKLSCKNATLERFINQYITLHYNKVI